MLATVIGDLAAKYPDRFPASSADAYRVRRAAGPLRRAGGDRRGGGVPGLRRRVVHHRRGVAGGWRRHRAHDARRIAVVTGGTRGIGRAIADRLAADGWGVIWSLARHAPADCRIGIRACDVTDAGAGARACSPGWRSVDALVNCAGLAGANALDGDDALWHAIIARQPARHVSLLQGGAAAAAGRHRAHRQYRLGAGACAACPTRRPTAPPSTASSVSPGRWPWRSRRAASPSMRSVPAGSTPTWRGSASANWASPPKRRRPACRPATSPRRRRSPTRSSGCCGRSARSITGHALPIDGGRLALP